MVLWGISKVVVCFVRHIENRQGRFLWEANVLNQTKQNVLAFGVKETQFCLCTFQWERQVTTQRADNPMEGREVTQAVSKRV